MRTKQNNKLYILSFTLCMCAILLVIFTTGAYLSSSKTASGTIGVGTFGVYFISDTSSKTNLSGSTITNNNGEYAVSLTFGDDVGDLYVYNSGNTPAYVRVSVVSSYSSYITLSPLTVSGQYTWTQQGSYFYLTTTAGARKALPGATYYQCMFGYTLSELPAAALSGYTFTYQLKLEAIQAANTDSGTHGNLIWTSGLPSTW